MLARKEISKAADLSNQIASAVASLSLPLGIWYPMDTIIVHLVGVSCRTPTSIKSQVTYLHPQSYYSYKEPTAHGPVILSTPQVETPFLDKPHLYISHISGVMVMQVS